MQSLLWINKNKRLMAKSFKVIQSLSSAKNNKLSLYDVGNAGLFYVAN